MSWLTNDHLKSKPPKGDTLVWLSSLGLAFGIVMVVVLLSIIVVKGVQVFWPDRVVEITVPKAIGDTLPGGQPKLAVEFVKHQPKNIQRDPKAIAWETQVFQGSKEIFGQGFRYIDDKDILEKNYPKDILVAERMQNGEAIFYPLAVVHGGTRLEATSPEFRHKLHELLKDYAKRRADILKLEKHKIGKLNSKMTDLRQKEKTASPERKAQITQETAALQKEYEALAKQAADQRALMDDDQIIYRLSSGQEKTLPLGELIHVYAPNDQGLLTRLGIFCRRVWAFLSEEPRESNTEGGIFPAIFGTFTMTLLMSLAVTPFGVVAAIYLREYAKQGLLVRIVRICVNNLAGVPSIVFGVFGLAFFVYIVGGAIDERFFPHAEGPVFKTGGILWASVTLALLTLPVVIVATEEALAAVPRGVREAALACGASKWQTIQRVVLPSAAPGVLTGLILAMARGAGEVAPLMLVGVVKIAPSLPIDGTAPFIHPERKFMHLGFHIYDLAFQSPDSEAAKPILFATTFLLILLVVILNLGAILIRDRLRKKYAAGTF
jgi:phosphate transport system permease protein